MQQWAGRSLAGGRYDVGELIGCGVHARVYRGRDKILERPVALKILPLPEDGNAVPRWRREAFALDRLDHPRIVRVFDGGEDDDVGYLVRSVPRASARSPGARPAGDRARGDTGRRARRRARAPAPGRDRPRWDRRVRRLARPSARRCGRGCARRIPVRSASTDDDMAALAALGLRCVTGEVSPGAGAGRAGRRHPNHGALRDGRAGSPVSPRRRGPGPDPCGAGSRGASASVAARARPWRARRSPVRHGPGRDRCSVLAAAVAAVVVGGVLAGGASSSVAAGRAGSRRPRAACSPCRPSGPSPAPPTASPGRRRFRFRFRPHGPASRSYEGHVSMRTTPFARPRPANPCPRCRPRRTRP